MDTNTHALPSTSPFSIHPAIPADVPTLAKIFADSLANERVTQLKALDKDADWVPNMIREPLNSWVKPEGSTYVLKATDNATGEIMGWVCWGRSGYEKKGGAATVDSEESLGESESKEAEQVPEGDEQPATEEAQAPPAAEQGQQPRHKTPADLDALTSEDMERWQKILMPEGKRCMFICAITVSPAHQSLGVGSALIQSGIAKADADGVSCWVHASEAGYKPFAKAGFEEVGRLDLDLDEYALVPREEGARGENAKWGSYTFRYMLRPPSSAAS